MHFILISFPAQKKSRKCDTLDGFGFILHKNNYRFFAGKSKNKLTIGLFTPDRHEGPFTVDEKEGSIQNYSYLQHVGIPRRKMDVLKGRHIMIIFQYYGFCPCLIGIADSIVVTSAVIVN